ncbi:hypothetical protein NL676_015298 [Syzygium grande]|nr:hypothetical protein NL676_015298 [Syzygium grande]
MSRVSPPTAAALCCFRFYESRWGLVNHCPPGLLTWISPANKTRLRDETPGISKLGSAPEMSRFGLGISGKECSSPSQW